MKKETEFTSRELILAKADVVRNMPEYRAELTFEAFTETYWHFDGDKYATDADYAREIRDAYRNEVREREAFNAVLDLVFNALA